MREIALVGHSMGGLMIKQMFRYASSQIKGSPQKDIISRVTKVAFLATPHHGSSGATIIDSLRIIFQPSISTSSLIKNNPVLRELNNWYKDTYFDRNVEHLILMESQPVGKVITIVTPDSADPGLRERAKSIEANHTTICKPENKNSASIVIY